MVFQCLHAHINKRYQKKKSDLMKTHTMFCAHCQDWQPLLLHACTQPTSTIACVNTTNTNDLCYTEPKLECLSTHDIVCSLKWWSSKFLIISPITHRRCSPKMFFTWNTPKTLGATCPRWLEFTLKFVLCSTNKLTLNFILCSMDEPIKEEVIVNPKPKLNHLHMR